MQTWGTSSKKVLYPWVPSPDSVDLCVFTMCGWLRAEMPAPNLRECKGVLGCLQAAPNLREGKGVLGCLQAIANKLVALDTATHAG